MSWVGGHNQLWSEDYTEWYTQCVYPWNPGQTYPSHQGAQHLGDGVWPIFDMMPLFLPCLPQTIIPEHGTSQYCNSLGSSSSIALSPGRFEPGHILLVFLSYSHTEIFFSDESSEEIPHSSQCLRNRRGCDSWRSDDDINELIACAEIDPDGLLRICKTRWVPEKPIIL